MWSLQFYILVFFTIYIDLSCLLMLLILDTIFTVLYSDTFNIGPRKDCENTSETVLQASRSFAPSKWYHISFRDA